MADEEKAVGTGRLATFLTQIKEIFAKKEIYDDDHVSLGRRKDTTVGLCSVTLGYDVTASGPYSHAEGQGSSASGYAAHAEGKSARASRNSAHAEGYNTKASGDYSHAEGDTTTASGNSSHAEGGVTTASGYYAHAEGSATIASGNFSHVEGYCTIARGEYSHVQGKYNIEDTQNIYAHIIGNGTGLSDDDRSNAHTLDWQGNAWFAGDVENGNGVSLNGLKALIDAMETGGASGTTDYTQLENKPEINGVELTGNITLAELGIQEMTYEETLAELNETEEAA